MIIVLNSNLIEEYSSELLNVAIQLMSIDSVDRSIFTVDDINLTHVKTLTDEIWNINTEHLDI